MKIEDAVHEIGIIFHLLQTSSQPLNHALWKKLIENGIARVKPTCRGCRAGSKKKRPISVVVTDFRESSRQANEFHSAEAVNLHNPSETSSNIHSDTSRPTNNNSGRIVVERTPFVPDRGKHSPLLTLCFANVRAVKSKTAALLEYIHSADMDIFAVTETWLTDKDAAAKMEFIPTETHKFVQCNHQGRRGGGTGLLFKKLTPGQTHRVW